MEQNWQSLLAEEKSKTYFQHILSTVEDQRRQGYVIFPKKEDTFNAFKYCPLEGLKVVILGQDPYHNLNQAHGLAFSVQKGIAIPPSLINIYKELQQDLGLPIPPHGCLTSWARQGVFLLNTVLTVQAHKAHSHTGIGWEKFTDTVIEKISQQKSHIVFMLWGAHAQKKVSLIDQNKHLILKAPHPSPLSAHRGFLGCKHFSQANAFLKNNGLSEINWSLEEATVA
ncbi:uracil-DNA glycosylase [Facilibium subflavum]|uniref:uracil-DNA glycosylase n=1 Tax=Facilibium subflavum TaxID=2219058 RepID=UPI000E64E8F2|nr:uracil-DNA glycosylase [Facilibium subflavum]